MRVGSVGVNVEYLVQDLRYGLRMFLKSRGFAIVAIVTLALGIGANTAMFSIVNAWLLRPLPLSNPQELVSVWRTQSQAPRQPAFFNLYHDCLVWASQNRGFQSLAATFEQSYGLTGAGGEPEQIDLDPDLPLGSMRTTSEIVSTLRSQPRMRAILLASLRFLTLLLATIGVGGMMGQMVEQRRRDIGIRMALGAMASDVQRLVLGHALRLTLAGMFVGLLGVVAVANVLRSFLFGVSVLDPVTFAVVIVLFPIVALLGADLPALRAAKSDPMDALRSE
jgi:hypothetical protein